MTCSFQQLDQPVFARQRKKEINLIELSQVRALKIFLIGHLLKILEKYSSSHLGIQQRTLNQRTNGELSLRSLVSFLHGLNSIAL